MTSGLKRSLILNLMILSGIMLFPYPSTADGFSDNFNKGHAEQWKSYGGIWRVENRQYSIKGSRGYSLAKGINCLSLIYEADIWLTGKGNAGLIFNVTDPYPCNDSLNCYYVALNKHQDKVFFFKINRKLSKDRKIPLGNLLEGNKEEIISIPYSFQDNKTHHLKVVKAGSFIDIFLNNDHMLSLVDKTHTIGEAGLMSDSAYAIFDNIKITDRSQLGNPVFNWSWVKGVSYIPSNCVNQVQHWEEFDPVINERELSYAEVYGFNLIRIYLHYLVWEKNKSKFLADIETFLTIADRHKLKTEIIFFDDIWNKYPHLGPQLPPIPGVHNSRWMQCPGDKIKDDYPSYKEKLRSYVQDVVNAHKHDRRIVFWEPYNEPGFSQQGKYIALSKQLLNDSRIWIKQTSSSIPVTAAAEPGFLGEGFSDFFSWHDYQNKYMGPRGPEVLNTECMERRDQSVPGVVENYGKQETGYIFWDLCIGRDNCRFPWDNPENAPEVTIPFHGIIYPDGHPWDTNDIKAIRGDLENLEVFNVDYFTENFSLKKKSSITPCIDFDLGDERGTGSPDASAGIEKDSFSIRWTGKIRTEFPGEYVFYIDNDHIARLWIDGVPIINKSGKERGEIKKTVIISSGKWHEMIVEYIHDTGNASMHVSWSGPDFSKKIVTAKRH